MATQKKNNIPADKLDLYDKLIKTNPKIERKGAANPYTSLNGHMFTYLNPSGSLALRLPPDAREAFLKRYKTTLFEAYGAVMKEYVTVPDKLLRNTKELKRYFELSYAYVSTLKPKPSSADECDHDGSFPRYFLEFTRCDFGCWKAALKPYAAAGKGGAVRALARYKVV